MSRRIPSDLAVREHYQVPRIGNTRISDVFSPLGTAEVVAAWGGATVDTLRKDFLVFGGGHTDSTDNAVYAFCFDPTSANFLTWRRKVSSSPVAANDDSETNADGSPASRHTYNTLHYDAALDQMLVFPGGFLAGPGGIKSVATWGFDCATENPDSSLPSAWTRYDDDLSASLGNARASAAYDPVSAKYYVQFATGFASFDPTLGAGSQWTGFTTFEGPNTSDNTVDMALLSPSQMVWVNTADGGELWSRFLSDPWAYIGNEANGIGATGDINILDIVNPGMRWEPQLNRLVMWGGLATGGTDRRDTYVVDVLKKTVTRQAGVGDTPTAPQVNGTFGRWAYLGGCGSTYSGLWLLVNSATEEPFFFRSSAGFTTEDVGLVIGGSNSFVGEGQLGARELILGKTAENGQGLVIGSQYSFIGEGLVGGPLFIPGQGPSGLVIGGSNSFIGESPIGAPETTATVVAVNQALETDTAQQIKWAPKIRIVSQALETDLSQALTRLKTRGVSQALETDLAQTISKLKTRVIGQAAESDLSQAITRLKSRILGEAQETDIAQAISRIKTLVLAQVLETDLSQVIVPIKTGGGGQTVAVGQALETDTAQVILWAPKNRLLNTAFEFDTAQPIGVAASGSAPVLRRLVRRTADRVTFLGRSK